MHGRRQLKLLNHNETYEMNSPKLCIRFLPVPGADWVGNVKIKCHETGLEAELFYKANPFIALRRNHRAVKGKVNNSSSSKILFEIDGHWDRLYIIQVLFEITDFCFSDFLVLHNLS